MSWTYRLFGGGDCAADDARELQDRLIVEGWPWHPEPDVMRLQPPPALVSALNVRSTNMAELARRLDVSRQAVRQRVERLAVDPPMWSLSDVLVALEVAWCDGARLSAECTVSFPPTPVVVAHVPLSDSVGGLAHPDDTRQTRVTVCLACGEHVDSFQDHSNNCHGGNPQ